MWVQKAATQSLLAALVSVPTNSESTACALHQFARPPFTALSELYVVLLVPSEVLLYPYY